VSNAQKIPYARALNAAATRKALDAQQLLGKALPCSVVAVSGSIVTVAFQLKSPFTIPNVTMPMFGPQYIRYPTQVGDLGVTLPADVYLGGISGLGGGIADLTLPANLSALVFFPIASTNWSATEDANAVVIYGPDGAILRDANKTTQVKVDAGGNVTVHGLTSFSWDVNGYGQRYTYNGGSAFTLDTYTTGATVTTVSHAWTPPSLPAV
jgi:hypothetical protein